MNKMSILSIAAALAVSLGLFGCSPAASHTGIVTYEEEYLERGYTMCAFSVKEDLTNKNYSFAEVYRSNCIRVHKGSHVRWCDVLGDNALEVIE